MIPFLKANCLAAFALAIVSLWVELPGGTGPWFQKLAGVILGLHVLETPFYLSAMRRLGVPLWQGLGHSLVFGLLYGWPLMRQAKAQAAKGPSA